MRGDLPKGVHARLALLAACVFPPLVSACFVEGHCRTDEDCDPPEVCNEKRVCALECHQNGDCLDSEICQSSRCVPAPGCAGCRFDHAEAICVHGDCPMGTCDPGWVDGNRDARDGCEYFCTPSGEEVCDGTDNDCDTVIDEDFDLTRDIANCGRCGNACPPADHASPVCAGGQCGIVCDEGWFNVNGRTDDGCESDECIPSEEICDGLDNDCDGDVDEGFDKTLPDSCGPFCTVCEYDHAEPLCVEGECAIGECESGWYDSNRWDGDGCEYPCTPTGDEVCDEADNDCDGYVDEGILCCPDDMVSVEGSFCIDIYEASLELGEDDALRAVSRVDVMPYWDRNLTVEQASAYCAASGKRLCNAAEWVRTCRGPQELLYCYGDDYEPTTCNGIDAFGEGSHQLAPTGAFPGCVNDYGIYDINGNVWEMTEDAMVRGGAYNCLDSATLHQCTYSIDPSRVIAIGFRCCL